MDVLVSGKTSFKVEVPYTLFQTGQNREKPLIIYLHGYNQNIEAFKTRVNPFFKLEAYHLFIQGPYANVGEITYRSKWGFSWYLYSGKQGSFIKSLEYTSEFIQGVIDNLSPHLNVNRLCMVGYSMGGYQAGYFGLSRWKHTNDLIVIGGRLKTEAFSKNKLSKCKHMNIIAVHGKDDESVSFRGQEQAIEHLKGAGLNAKIIPVEGGHKLTNKHCTKAVQELKKIGYFEI